MPLIVFVAESQCTTFLDDECDTYTSLCEEIKLLHCSE
jgi:hypothetical protein